MFNICWWFLLACGRWTSEQIRSKRLCDEMEMNNLRRQYHIAKTIYLFTCLCDVAVLINNDNAINSLTIHPCRVHDHQNVHKILNRGRDAPTYCSYPFSDRYSVNTSSWCWILYFLITSESRFAEFSSVVATSLTKPATSWASYLISTSCSRPKTDVLTCMYIMSVGFWH